MLIARRYPFKKHFGIMSTFSSAPLRCLEPVPSDIDISQSIEPVAMSSIAESAGLLPSEYMMYGESKCKVSLSVKDRLAANPNGNYVLVTGMYTDLQVCGKF